MPVLHINRQARRYLGLALLSLPSALCHAADAGMDDPLFLINGFGTVGVVHSSEDKADFTSTIYKPEGAGYSNDWSFNVDSLIAVQVTANFTPKLSAVVQAVSELNYDGSYRPRAEWANVKHQFTPDFSVRVGRSLLPSFLFSETRLVTYSYPWVRPPRELYALSPITSYDGLDASYRFHLGEWINTVRVVAGRSDTDLPGGVGAIKVRDLRQIANTIESGPVTLHLSYQRLYLSVPSLKAFFDTFRLFEPDGIALADRYDLDHKLYTLIGVGANYDPGQWFITGEWGHLNTRSLIGELTAWYASSGYRLGNFTPYLTYAEVNADNLTDPGVAAPEAAGLNAALNSLLMTKYVQKSVSVGGRWDFAKNASLKIQFEYADIGAGSTGVLRNPQPGFQTGGTFTMFSLAVDFVF